MGSANSAPHRFLKNFGMIDDVRQAALDYHCHPEQITLTDINSVVHAERNNPMLPNMRRFAHRTDDRKLAEVIAGADIFLGLSTPAVFKPDG